MTKEHKDYLQTFECTDTIGFFRTETIYEGESNIFILSKLPNGAEDSRFIIGCGHEFDDMEAGKVYTLEEINNE